MRHDWRKRVAGLALLAMAFCAAPALAQQRSGGGGNRVPPTVLAVFDGQRIFRDASAFKNARQQLDRYRVDYQAEIGREEEKLRAEEQELSRQRAILSPDAFETRRKDFERRVTDFQRKAQERSRSLEQVITNVRTEVTKMVRTIVTEMAGERGFNIVMDNAQVIFRADSLDITDEVLRRLDQRLPSVKVTPPPPPQ